MVKYNFDFHEFKTITILANWGKNTSSLNVTISFVRSGTLFAFYPSIEHSFFSTAKVLNTCLTFKSINS